MFIRMNQASLFPNSQQAGPETLPKKVKSKAKKVVREREQVAALPFRRVEDGVEVCLVTTRTTHRWSLPKGWPIKGRKVYEAAEIEAREEAGVKGQIRKRPIGRYRYFKRQKDHFELVRVSVFPLEVRKQLKIWPEHHQRSVSWWSLPDAVVLADEPGVAKVLLDFVGSTSGKSERRKIEALLQARAETAEA